MTKFWNIKYLFKVGYIKSLKFKTIDNLIKLFKWIDIIFENDLYKIKYEIKWHKWQHNITNFLTLIFYIYNLYSIDTIMQGPYCTDYQ